MAIKVWENVLYTYTYAGTHLLFESHHPLIALGYTIHIFMNQTINNTNRNGHTVFNPFFMNFYPQEPLYMMGAAVSNNCS